MNFLKKSPADRRKMILEGNILSTLFILSLPTIIMALVQSMIPVFDGFFLNNYGGVLVAGAVTFSAPVINILNGLSMGLGSAGMAIIGQFNGLGDVKRVKHMSLQLLFFGLILGIISAPLLYFLAKILTNYVNPEVAPYIFQYLSLYSFVMPMLFMAAIYNGIKNAMGQPEATLIRMIMLMVLKLIFSFIFLKVFSLGAKGAVFSSFCSYTIITLWLYYDLFIKQQDYRLSFKNFRPDWASIREYIRIGLPSMLASMFVYLGFFLINMEVQSYGPKVLAAQGIASNINALTFTVPSSISTTVTTMMAMNVGSNNIPKAKDVYKKSLIMGAILSISMIVIITPLSRSFVEIFQRTIKDEEIISIATHALKIYNFSVFGFTLYMVVQGALLALGRTKITLAAGLLRVWGFRYIFILLTKHILGVNAVFWGNLFSNTICAALYIILFYKIPFKSDIIDLDHLS
ncbi:MATE family efflux transporter [uncultured Peptoniphilus sp.]|uniref:MATE family efflux transporter n=1 Tax=uncultured Peptoniphilus sp. TaxID=254354 RepID=UPI0028055E4B|nr:MATE family efflux transporter [uncultured Peptoniphilus sp.]